MTIAREITRELRDLFPRPVRLSVRDISLPGATLEFLVRLPSAPANHIGGDHGLQAYLARRLDTRVRVLSHRTINRRDCGRDVEFVVSVGRRETTSHTRAGALADAGGGSYSRCD